MAENTDETMVKATVDSTVNEAIEDVQEQYDVNKQTATERLLMLGASRYKEKRVKNAVEDIIQNHE